MSERGSMQVYMYSNTTRHLENQSSVLESLSLCLLVFLVHNCCPPAHSLTLHHVTQNIYYTEDDDTLQHKRNKKCFSASFRFSTQTLQ